jgi:Mg-chelatase subunit ChlD
MICAIALWVGTFAVSADEKGVPPEKKPQVEVCFVLDTTGSMEGLIEGAKAKIWAMANQIVKQKPSPDVKVALIGYRDRGDAYVTRRFDLTADIDLVFKNLSEFKAEGGGDEPEAVNQALDEAVNKITWSADRSTLKVIFLVGDAPPHMDYAGEKQYPAVCKEAAKRDLIINTVQCGGIAATTPVWREIAKSSEGEFAAIAQDGNVAVVSAPQDKEIAELNGKLGTTYVAVAREGQAYHDATVAVSGAIKVVRETPAAALADRSEFLLNQAAATTRPTGGTFAGLAPVGTPSGGAAYYGGIRVGTGRNELLDELASGSVKLDDLKDEQLPPEMRKMTKEERAAFVAGKQKERAEIQARIAELSKARAAYLEEAKKRAVAAGAKADSFDEKVNETIRRQAEAKRR